jgi:uncharacterized protein (TIGR02001 family)
MSLRSGPALFLLAAAPLVHADWSASLTAASEYELTGISQSASRPVVQAGVLYFHDSGLYAGSWASSGIDFGCCDAGMELDYYIGYFRETGFGFSWDASLNDYTYPGSRDLGYTEAALAVTAGGFSLRHAWSNDFLGTGRSGYYLEAACEVRLHKHWYGLLHAGRTGGPAFRRALIGFPAYTDYALGLAWRTPGWAVKLRRVEALLSARDRIDRDLLRTTGRWVLEITYRID